MKTTEYITPGGAKVVIRDPQSADAQKRLERAVAEFMKKQGGVHNERL
jgi:hypothetical protein